ncbi:hypothetical protein DU502_05440 [Haloplanus aerogenes]|uniref:Uncharacterized protein n=1 Tax=Haloplanus aerogenes TaxID=660522 RepID=A0A3G8QTS6_9EURY|nr:hypothetical protein DU502_05440 [Haloplanus aerogenes]
MCDGRSRRADAPPVSGLVLRPLRRQSGQGGRAGTATTDAERAGRLSAATGRLVERQVDVRTMASIGGWSADSAIEPSLAEPTEGRQCDRRFNHCGPPP